MASSRVRETVSDIEAQILAAARGLDEIRTGTADEAEKVRDEWRRIAPKDTGAYAASINVRRLRRDRDGMPVFRVEADDFKAHWIEYGTGSDPDGTKSKFGPDTPTPEFAPARRVAAMFGGTIGPADK
ncbi:HK97 gp10 family phage protein [Mycolicibacterium neoaurum]|uniref:HK97 gp10 family phage protein n=1 Tax=Mycolicibacterium neoaurum TaxID=1795 RepID=UPI00055CC75C